MSSATNDTSRWIFFFFQRCDGWVQLSLIPKDYKSRIIVLDKIAEAVEKSPLSCLLTSKPKQGTYEQRGSLLKLCFVQLLESGERHLVERQLDLTEGPPFKWDRGKLEYDDSVRVPASIFPITEDGERRLICVSQSGELSALHDDCWEGWCPILPESNISILSRGSLFFRLDEEYTGYWQLPFIGGQAGRLIVLAYVVGQQKMTRYEIRHWFDDQSSEPRIESDEIDLNLHGLDISPSPNSYLPLYNYESDEEELLGMVGFYCKTRDDQIYYFSGHYEDKLKQPEFVCSVKAGSEIHLLSGCSDLLFISVENELTVSRRTVDATGTVHHKGSCLHRPSNYFVTELDKLAAPGPLDGYIPPRVQEIVLRNN